MQLIERHKQLKTAHERCRESLIWAIGLLKGQVDPEQLGNIAELIIQTMTGTWRVFHTPEHIFEVGGSKEPIEVLAALFHDLVYEQVDKGVNLNISRYITPFVRDFKGQLTIRSAEDLPQDRLFEIVVAIFGFTPSQVLSPFSGQNEFLSAIVAAKCLESFLEPEVIAKITACIEATIPFRPKHESGLTSTEMLLDRMRKVNEQFNFGWTEAETIEAVKRAVRLANRDVENFASASSANFLDNTWNLMPETNHKLANANSYTVAGYRSSLQKMQVFMSSLKPELVFQQFMGEPDDATYRLMLERTQKNLEVAKLYLGIKLVTIAILEALSYRLGKEIPLSTMMGELPIAGISTPTLEQFLPEIKEAYPSEIGMEREVLEVLAKGRNQESPYDIKNSPLSTFIIKSVGFSEMGRLLLLTKEFFAENMSAEDFLSHCDANVIDTIISGVAKLFESRTTALRGGVNSKIKVELGR